MTVSRYTPNVVWSKVFSFLGPIDLANAHPVSTQWRLEASNDRLWKTLFPNIASPVKPMIDRQIVRSEGALFRRVQEFARSLQVNREAMLQIFLRDGSSEPNISFKLRVSSNRFRIFPAPEPVILRLLPGAEDPGWYRFHHAYDISRHRGNDIHGPSRSLEGEVENVSVVERIVDEILPIVIGRQEELMRSAEHRLLLENSRIRWLTLFKIAAVGALLVIAHRWASRHP